MTKLTISSSLNYFQILITKSATKHFEFVSLIYTSGWLLLHSNSGRGSWYRITLYFAQNVKRKLLLDTFLKSLEHTEHTDQQETFKRFLLSKLTAAVLCEGGRGFQFSVSVTLQVLIEK